MPDMTMPLTHWLSRVCRLRLETRCLSQDNAGTTRSLKVVQRTASSTSLAILLLLSACTRMPKSPLTAADAADVDQVTAYLNSIPRFQAHFVQFGSFGPDAGLVSLDRPAGHLRIDYTDPDARVMVVADGKVLIKDRSTGATTTMKVSRTPLGMLLARRIILSGAVTVTSLAHYSGRMQITLEKTDRPSQGSLTLTLADRPLRLTAVTVTDAEQRTLTLNLSSINLKPTLTPSMFQPPTPASGG